MGKILHNIQQDLIFRHYDSSDKRRTDEAAEDHAKQFIPEIRKREARLEEKLSANENLLRQTLDEFLTDIKPCYDERTLLRVPSNLSLGSDDSKANSEDAPWEPKPYQPAETTRTSAKRKNSKVEGEIRDALAADQSVNVEQYKQRIWLRREVMNEAQRVLDGWKGYCDAEYDAFQKTPSDVSMTLTDFDRQILKKEFAATRELIEAENAWDEARIAAHEVNVHRCDSYQESLFSDFDFEDSRSAIADAERNISGIDRGWVRSWMADIDCS
jgi:hypothetical protein